MNTPIYFFTLLTLNIQLESALATIQKEKEELSNQITSLESKLVLLTSEVGQRDEGLIQSRSQIDKLREDINQKDQELQRRVFINTRF